MKSLFFGLIIAFLLVASHAKADFLGLAPGDYVVTLTGTAGPCGGSNCVGTIHIPTGPVTTTNFSWYFNVSQGVTSTIFDWSPGDLAIDISSNGLYSCAEETGGASCGVNDDGTPADIAIGFPGLLLAYFINPIAGVPERYYQLWANCFTCGAPSGTWSATSYQTPEPAALILLGLALVLSKVFLRRKRLKRSA